MAERESRSKTDDELVNAAVEGDRSALDELLVRHLSDLRAYIRLRMGPGLRAREGESDLLQSICREVLAEADRFQRGGEGAFRGWLFTVALRKLSDRGAYYRAERRDLAREQAEDVGGLLDCYKRFATPSQHAIAGDQLESIERAFAGLPSEYREVVLLSRVVGLDRAGVAREMGKSEGAVRNLLHRALARIASAIESAPQPGQAGRAQEDQD